MNCCEGLLEGRAILHYKEPMKKGHHPGIFAGGKSFSGRANLDTPQLANNQIGALRSLISEYTTRRLTYKRDSLNAFVGTMEHFQARDPAPRHIWGITIKQNEVSRCVDNLFLWFHRMDSGSVLKRRRWFPSWA
jgi:hypothetical protein